MKELILLSFVRSHLSNHLSSSTSQGLAPAFQDMNAELGKFIDEMQRQGIWEDVAIVLGSEFGRSVPTNSNGGTDHGWAG